MNKIISKNTIIEFFDEKTFLIAIFLSATTYVMRFSAVESNFYIYRLVLLLRLITYSLVGIKFLINLFLKKYNKYLVLISLLSILMILVSYQSKTIGYFVYFVLIVVGYNVDYLKIIKTALLAICINVSLVLVFCLIGVIPDLVYQSTNRIRHALGFGNPPLLSNYVFYATLYYIYIKKNKIKLPTYFILFIINSFIFFKTRTKSAYCLSLLSIFFSIVLSYTHICYKVRSILYKLVLVLPTISALFAILISYFYDPDNIILFKLNSFLTGRLALGNSALNNYGIRLFGQHIVFHGYNNTNDVYNIIDSSFVLYLIILGIVFVILLVVYLTIFVKLIYKKDDIYFAVVFMIVILHSIFDAQLMQISYNYFMFIVSYYNHKLEFTYE